MICKGNLHGNGVKLVDYLMSGEHGERVQLGGARGFEFFGSDLRSAAAVMQRLALETTRCEKPWFHTQTRLAPGERLNLAQWEQTLDREEKRLGFAGLPRAWSFHVDEATGEMHMHAAWFRIDSETGRARDPGLFKLRLMEVARTCELEFGLREVGNARQAHDRARAAERNEQEESRRLGTDVRAIRAAILDCLEHADSGKAFRAALEEHGLVLANGDKRDCFMVIDEAGGHHALNKKLTGITLAAMRERMADLDRAQLPSVAEAQAMQRERQKEREQAGDGMLSAAPRHGYRSGVHRRGTPHHRATGAQLGSRRRGSRLAGSCNNAGIARDAGTEQSQPGNIDDGRRHQSASRRATDPAATRIYDPNLSRDYAARESFGDRILGSIGRVFTALADFAANFIAPPPPPTKDQAMRAAMVAEERQEARVEQLAQQEKLAAQNWLIAELQRQQQAREREDEEN